MLQRCKWSLIHFPMQNNQALNALSLLIHYLSSPLLCTTEKTYKLSRENIEEFQKKNKLVVTPEIVRASLLDCPSDLIALSFFFWCAKQNNYFHDAQTFDHMVGIVKNLTVRYGSVEGIVKELKNVGCVIKAQTFLLLLRIYWRAGMYDIVFEAFEEMTNFGFVPNTFARNIIMDVLFKMGYVDLALQVLKEIQFPNFLSFNIALCSLCKLNDLNNVKNVIRVMLREGFYPNVETFEMILNCFCKVGRRSEAYQILALMSSLGISISVKVWNILIDGFCRLGKPWMAEALLNKMLEISCSPNILTYTILIKGFMDSGMVGTAFNILRTMESEGHIPDLVLCNILIDCLSKIGRFDDALDVFVSLLKWKLVPDSCTFSSLLSNICLSRRFSLLPDLVSGFVIDLDLVACNSLLSYFCKARLPSFAVELYNDMLDRGFMPDKYSFVGVLSGLCGAGRIAEAVNVYQGMVLSHLDLDAHVHTIIIDRLIRAGKCQRAICLFRRAILKKYPLDVVSYTVVICGLIKAGRMEEAYSLYTQMEEVGIVPNAHTYDTIISGFGKEKDVKVIKVNPRNQ